MTYQEKRPLRILLLETIVFFLVIAIAVFLLISLFGNIPPGGIIGLIMILLTLLLQLRQRMNPWGILAFVFVGLVLLLWAKR